MQFGLSIAFSQSEDYIPLAVAAEQNGFDAVTLPDHLIYPQTLSVPYPYTPDGVPRFTDEDPFPDPWLAAVAMAGATARLRRSPENGDGPSGKRSSRYSRMAADSQRAKSPSTMAGTLPRELIAR